MRVATLLFILLAWLSGRAPGVSVLTVPESDRPLTNEALAPLPLTLLENL